ncbi:MAG: RtcB family protein [Chlamydiales bacterium]|nr:RtcB family protein [Chlamydiales bacterium]
MSDLEKKSPGIYILPMRGGMRVPGLIVANEELLADMEIDKPLEQVANVAYLQGIIGYSIAMPDIHWGYGFPIGGVAAMDADYGVISPGGVGYDINCGVRLAMVPEKFTNLNEKIQKQLLDRIFKLVPSGVGKGHGKARELSDQEMRDLTTQGARWSIQKGFGFAEDLDHMESHGVIEGADVDVVSHYALDRGRGQLGTIGSGNHFVEIGAVDKIYRSDIAEAWGVEEGQIYILIHSGSRGFGHQVCQETLDSFISQGYAKDLPDKQLVAAPLKSHAGQQYFKGMAAAANFAFNNRQQILHGVRKAIHDVLNIAPQKVRLIYDVCHNIAKFETHEFEGVQRRLCVHRKGATRAFGPGNSELNPVFRKTGQPVLVPGDMGRASHLMVGCGNPITWSSACHGAGRARSRHASKKAWEGRDPLRHMECQHVRVMATSLKTIVEEMPDAYKNVDVVVAAVEEAKLANMVARLRPHLVVKG